MYAGTAVAPGIAIGPALVWTSAVDPLPMRTISPGEVRAEHEQLEQAVRRARRELELIARRVAATVGESAAAVFRAHRLMLDDPAFLATTRLHIAEQYLTAESAVSRAVRDLAAAIAGNGHGYLSARAEDVEDLGRRILAHLRKEHPATGPRLERDCVLIADTLAAADVVSLDRSRLLALVISETSATSHAAILAATLGVPVVTGIPHLTGSIATGDIVIVDGNHGHLVVHPTDLALRQYRTRSALFEQFSGELAGLRDAPAVTSDGRALRITANIGIVEEIPYAIAQGCEGIGLVRTEVSYLAQPEPPGEDEQYEVYAAIVKAVAPRPVAFRTLDIGGDKLSQASAVAMPEPNPMLGCRGIRLLHEQREVFVTQVRALLRAACHGPIDIVFPLITSLTEFQDTRRLVEQVRCDMRRRPADHLVRYGCMIETPAAATIPDLLASEAEFFSIGSNDLIQYTLAADRMNPRVAYMYEPLHLAILRMMRSIIRAAHRRDRPVRLCGEMAADPIYTIILLGLGVDELSMSPVMIPAIKQVIRGVSWEEARAVARGVLRERRAKDVQSYLEDVMSTRFPRMMSAFGHRSAP
jgi:phosphotransferase system enzyme I (PtsI)